MATKDFERNGYRYVSSIKVRYNGKLGRFSGEYREQQGCWVYLTQRWHPLKATRDDIAGPEIKVPLGGWKATYRGDVIGWYDTADQAQAAIADREAREQQ